MWRLVRASFWLLAASALCWHMVWKSDALGLFMVLVFLAATIILDSGTNNR